MAMILLTHPTYTTNRSPVGSMTITEDGNKIMIQNDKVFEAWYQAWLTSCVPTLMHQPKWFKSDIDPKVADVVLFLKSEQEFDRHYQYGIVTVTYESKGGIVRAVEVEYQNSSENVKRTTKRGVRDLVVIHEVDEIGISAELDQLSHCTHVSL